MTDKQSTSGGASDRASGILIDCVATMECSRCGCLIDTHALNPFTAVTCPSCGHTETVPGRLGDFLLLGLIGTGGMGGVYYAKDESLGRYVAIKVMLESTGTDPQFVETFKREAQAAAKLNHPHIAQIYSFGQEKGQPYIVMELVPGKGLDTLMQDGKPLDEAVLLQIGLDIAEGLKAADEIGLIHGDIKPENILLDEKNNAKLVDFGIATFVSQAQPEGIWGTPYYIAPEKVKRQKTGPYSDIYSLGATLYHALAGRPPFEADTPVEVVKARLEHPPPPLRDVRPDIHESVAAIIERMLQAEPAMRYPTYSSLISDMRRALKEIGPPRGAAGKAKKVLIKRKTHSALTDALKAQTGNLPVQEPADAAGEAPAPDSEEARAARRAARAKAARRLLFTALILAVLGGLVYGALEFKKRRDARLEARRRDVALALARRDTAASAAELGRAVERVAGLAEAGQVIALGASNTVRRLLDRPLFSAPPTAADTPPAAAELPAPAPAATNAAPPSAVVTGAVPAAAVATNAVSEAAASTGAVPAAAVATNVVPETAVPAAADPDEQALLDCAGAAWKGAAALRLSAADARALEREAREALDRARTAPAPAAAQTEEAAVADRLARVRRLTAEARETFDRVDADGRRVSELATRIERRREEERRRREEEAEQQRREAERRRRDAERQARIAADRAAVATWRAEQADRLAAYEYREASRAVAERLSELETPEGREAARVLQERYRRLDELKTFIIEQLNRNPFRWGWGWGAGARDILGADETHIQVRDERIPWDRVTVAQMMKFINHYVSGRQLGIRTRGEQQLAAAIYCYEAVGTDQALAAARNFAARAVSLLPNLENEVERLMPELTE
ncbi:MAG: serine/threonine protein kinase [Lentisphaerae bacterium]|nr:serine/threonine protein kinase [Lentisphaerota bacterium]